MKHNICKLGAAAVVLYCTVNVCKSEDSQLNLPDLKVHWRFQPWEMRRARPEYHKMIHRYCSAFKLPDAPKNPLPNVTFFKDRQPRRINDVVVTPMRLDDKDGKVFCELEIRDSEGKVAAKGSFCEVKDYREARELCVDTLSLQSSIGEMAMAHTFPKIDLIGDFSVATSRDNPEWILFVRGNKFFHIRNANMWKTGPARGRNIVPIAKWIDEAVLDDSKALVGGANHAGTETENHAKEN